MDAADAVALPLLLALELSPDQVPRRLTFSRDDADALAACIAQDLRALVPALEGSRLAIAGALFDVVELLRPGFPVWTTLDELARRLPRAQLAQVAAFGTHAGRMPAQPLKPETTHADGPVRLLPISVLAAPEQVDALQGPLETELVGRGEAGAATADLLMRLTDLRFEHARYLTRNDLLALTCVQYEHANLAPLWTLLEAALLTPYRAENALSARGVPLHYADGSVTVQAPTAWLAAQPRTAAAGRRHALAGMLFELRQYAAVLDAHRLPLRLDGARPDDAGYLLEPLAVADPALDPPRLYAHQAPGLGVVAVSVAQHGGAQPRLLAHAYPLRPDVLPALLARLADDYGGSDRLDALGEILLGEHGLSAPARALH